VSSSSNDAAGARQISLSVVVPVYNERYLVSESLRRLRILAEDPHLSRAEIIVVDDGSSDGTAEILDAFRSAPSVVSPAERERTKGEKPVFPEDSVRKLEWIFLRHATNLGKGAAVRTGISQAGCDFTIIHDADLEYDPADICRIAGVLAETDADAVFGSRFSGGSVRRVLLFRHELGNRFLTFLCNLVSNLNLSDVWTCYKAVRTSLLKSIPLVSNDFRIEPELAIKLAKREARIFEVPISYYGRTYREGKKITWRDGVRALAGITRFAVSDRIYHEDEYGSQILARLSRAPRFNLWMADTIKPFCGERVLEIGSGVGNLSRALIPRQKYVASDVNPLYLQTLRNLEVNRPYLSTAYCDINDVSSFPKVPGGYDTVICLNVIEHVEDDHAALGNIKSTLAEGGRAIVLVPQGPANFGTLDEVLGHRRRYTRDSLTRLARECGLEVETMVEFNRTGSVAWFLNGKLMRRRSFGLTQIWMLNFITPMIRRIDHFLPIPPLSLIAVIRRPSQSRAQHTFAAQGAAVP
jgi:glycosyltransferase involved in cell wall biosynthesis